MSTKKKAAPKTTAAKKTGSVKKTAAKTSPKAKTAPAPKAKETPAEEVKAAPAPVQPVRKLSLLTAAYEVLASDSAALSTGEMVKMAAERGLWTPGAGKTPSQTLYSAIMREINAKGESSRFVKEARGRFKARV